MRNRRRKEDRRRSRRREEDRGGSRRRQEFGRGSLTDLSVDRLLDGKSGKVNGEYQIANTPTVRQTVKGDNYLIFDICDVNPMGFKIEPTICMKIWQSDNLQDDLLDGLHEENAMIRLIGVKCTVYQNTSQLTLNGDFSDGRIQLVNTASSPSKPMYGNAPLFGNNSQSKELFDGKHEVPFNPYPSSYSPSIKSASAPHTLELQTPKTTGKRVRGNSPASDIKRLAKRFLASRPLKRKKDNTKTKLVTFEQGKKLGITLKPETFPRVGGVQNTFVSSGKGAKVVKCDRDRTLIGMVIYEVNGDSSIRSKPLKEIKKLLVTQSNFGPVNVIFGPSVNLKYDSSELVSSPFSGRRLQSSPPSTPTIPKSSHPLTTPPPVSPILPHAVACKLCPHLQKQVESLKKRVELLEGKAPVRRLTNDEIEDLLENAESLTTRLRRELAKRAN